MLFVPETKEGAAFGPGGQHLTGTDALLWSLAGPVGY